MNVQQLRNILDALRFIRHLYCTGTKKRIRLTDENKY